jgi:ribosomal protein L13E
MPAAKRPRRRTVVPLGAAHLRRLERRIAALETTLATRTARLEQAVDVLTRLVRVVAIQHQRVKRGFGQLDSRSAHLTRSVLIGRTADTRRLTAAERRLEALERRLS